MSDNSTSGTEHRFLSILFCDLVDSTGHQFRMDPEAFEALLGAYRHAAFERIRAHGGHVARVIGDGILALFGWPRAQGRDAQDAVSCALEIGQRIARLDAEGRLAADATIAVRMAIETGWVLVGSIGPEGETERDGVVGPAPNIAARLQRLARHNGVVVGEGTLPLLGTRFSIEPADTTGIELPMPIAAAHVTGVAGPQDLLGRLVGGRRNRLVGREAESARLHTLWERACTGSGQVVLMSGEAGIGKSRLLGALAATLSATGHERMVAFCTPQTTDSSLYPLIEPLRLSLGLPEDAEADAIRAATSGLAERLSLPAAAGEALASLLGAPSGGMPPTELRRWTFDALLSWIGDVARRRPLLLVVEDVHWADPSLSAFLRVLADEVPGLPVLLALSYRSNYVIAWPDAPSRTRIPLSPLPPAEAAALAEVAAEGLSEELREAVVARAEGVPLFVEEFARALSERGATPDRLPGSLSQLLAARLDALGPARTLAQIAAVVGRETPRVLLQDLTDMPADQFDAAVEQLLGSGIMLSRGVGESAVLSFHHMLLADAAYQALPSARRRRMHGEVADALARTNPALAAIEPGLLGRHREAAGQVLEAASLFRRAAGNATAAGAYQEAEAHARRAVRLSESVDGLEGRRATLSAMVLLGDAQIALLGYAATAVQHTFERATQIALGMGEASELLPVLRGLTAFYQVRGPMRRAEEVGSRLLQLARRINDPAVISDAERRQGWCLLCCGRLTEAEAALDRALVQYEAATPEQLTVVPSDPAVLGAGNRAWLTWLIEGDAAALGSAQAAAERAIAARQPLATAYGLGLAAVVHQLAGDWPGALGLARRAGAIASARGIAYWSAMAEMLEGWAQAMEGQTRIGLARIRHGMSGYRRTQGEILRPYSHILLAEAENAAGNQETALAVLDEAVEAAEQIGAAMYRPVLGWARGRILGPAAGGPILAVAEAEARRQGAIALAERIAALRRFEGAIPPTSTSV